MDKQVKVVGKHVNGCAAVRLAKSGEWSTPWGPIAYGERGNATVNTWRHYGKNGRKLLTWVRFVCNDTDCKAELHVESALILKAATREQRPQSRQSNLTKE